MTPFPDQNLLAHIANAYSAMDPSIDIWNPFSPFSAPNASFTPSQMFSTDL